MSAKAGSQSEGPGAGARAEAIRARGEALLDAMARAGTPSLFSRQGAYSRLMEWTLRDPAFKTQLFRFVDVLPVLDPASEVVSHLKEYLGDRAVDLHPALGAGLKAAGWAPGLVAGPVRQQVASMARLFVAGETAKDMAAHLVARARRGYATTVDLLGEVVLTEQEADAFVRRSLQLIEVVSQELNRSREPSKSDIGPHGVLPRLNLSVKVSALAPDVPAADPLSALPALRTRIEPILRAAQGAGAAITFDMESTRFKEVTFALFSSVLRDPGFAAGPALGIALQAYLRSADRDLESLLAEARRTGRRFTVRLVKGAYWDVETILAAQRNWPPPVWTRKAETDLCYERLSRVLLESARLVDAAFATHNVRSCAHAIVAAGELGVPPRAFEFQALYGMADELKAALLDAGFRVREYAPVGELLPGMAYFVRRLLENTSNEGFIRRQATGAATGAELLAEPTVHPAGPAPAPADKPAEFRNHPPADFTDPATRERFATAVAALGDPERSLHVLPGFRPGARWPLRISGEAVAGPAIAPSTDPADPARVVGHWTRATTSDAQAAIAALASASAAWARTPAAERCGHLERLADLITERAPGLAALEVAEVGKPWVEADADVAEAVDFCRYYAAEARRLGAGQVTQAVPGEDCRMSWQPRGPGVVIAPWNFPLAILCGLTVAPLVAGNPVIVKPAEQSSVMGAVFVDLLLESGFPPSAVALLTGVGEEIGPTLVTHPAVTWVAFTGSRAVGQEIWETAARRQPGQRHLRRVVCEMGGKNAIIVDTDADLDEAVPGVLASAFGYSGQKCSACSRLILPDALHDRFLERLVEAAASLRVGPARDPSSVVVPVIDAEARQRLLKVIDRGATEARTAFQGATPEGPGHWVPPTILADVRRDSFLAREEFFGPILSVLRARDLDEAFEIANEGDYALTGGLYSRRPSLLDAARERFDVGNLYLNRPITGAIVQRHPFGGHRMSGGGTKAGGPGYLENFVVPKVTAETTLRRGFVPET